MTWVEWLLIGGIIALFIYEILALVDHSVKTPSISELVWTASKRPLLPFAFGLLMGHFFWQRTWHCAEVVVSLLR